MPLPPGPDSSLRGSFELLRWMLHPTERFDASFRDLGEIYRTRTWLFGPEVVTSNPEHIKQIFTGDPDVFRGGEANRVIEAFTGPSSLLSLDGAPHHRMRRLLLPPFHGERMQIYGQTMIDVTGEVTAGWPEGTPFSLHPHMQRITLEIILRTVFGLEQGARLTELRDQLARLLDRAMSPLGMLLMVPALQRDIGPLTPWAAFLRERARTDRILHELIAQRRAEAARRDDVMGMLLDVVDEDGHGLTDAELRDQLMTLLAAGHETTATGLCWAFEQLLAHPEALERALAELDAVTGGGPPRAADLARLEYLDAAMKEALRLRPVIPMVGRRLKQPIQLGGYDIPTETLLIACPYLAQRHPDHWPEPAQFSPERFLGKKPDPYAWIPFGGGSRRCLGMAFALYEMKAVLAAILARFRLRLAKRPPLRVTLRAFAFAPEGGTPVVAARRSATA